MADKKIVISAGIDTSAFDRGIEQLKQKLQGLNSNISNANSVVGGPPSGINWTGGYSLPVQPAAAGAGDAYANALQQQRRSQILERAGWGDKKVGQQNQAAAESEKLKLIKIVDEGYAKEKAYVQDIEARLEKRKKIELEINKTIDERKKNGQDFIKQEETLQKIKNQNSIDEGNKKEAEERKLVLAEQKILLSPDKPRPLSSQIGETLAGNPIREFGSIMMSIAPELAAAAAALKAVASIHDLPIQNQVAEGQNVRNLSNQTAKDVFSGNLTETMVFAKQRQESIEKGNITEIEQGVPFMTYNPGFFSGVVAAASSVLTNEGRSDPFGINKDIQEGYKQKIYAAQLQKQNDVYQAGINKESVTQEALNKWQGISGPLLQTQRLLGLNDKDAYGYIRQGLASGFREDQTMSASQRLLNAGGTTISGRELATSANRLERNTSLSNASELLGKLSSTGMVSKDSEDFLLKVFEKGTTKGFDNSKFAQENRKYMEATVDLVRSSGTSSEADALEIEKVFSKFVDKNAGGREQEAGKTAYEAYSGLSRSGSGPQNLLRQVSLSKEFPGIRGIESMALSTMDIKYMTPDNPLVRSISTQLSASGQKISPEDVVKKLKRGVEFSSTTQKPTEDLVSKLKKELNTKEKVDEFLKGNNPDYANLVTQLSTTTDSLKGINVGSPEAKTFMRGLISKEQGFEPGAATIPADSKRLKDTTDKLNAQLASAAGFEKMVEVLPKVENAMNSLKDKSLDIVKAYGNAAQDLGTYSKAILDLVKYVEREGPSKDNQTKNQQNETQDQRAQRMLRKDTVTNPR